MYLEHFGLRRDPFAPEVDPRAFHPTRRHTEALECLAGAVRDARPLTILEGASGTGKTMMLRVLAAELPPPYRCLTIDGGGTVGLGVALARALAIDSGSEDEAYCGEAVGVWLAARLREGSRVVVAVDDAERLSPARVSEVKELATARPTPVRFVLAVDPDVDAGVALEEESLPPGTVRHRLEGIERAGLSGYLQARLMGAGARDPRLFTDAAVAVLWELTDGIPARVDAVAARSLLVAFGKREARVDHELVLRAAEQLAAGKKPPRPRPVVRPMRRREREAEEQRQRRERLAAAAGGGGARGGTWSSGPDPEPRTPDAETGPGVQDAPAEPPRRRLPESPGPVRAERTYRASADPQTEIDSLRDEAPTPAPPPPAVEGRSRPRGGAVPSGDEDPFRGAEPVTAPFGPEMLPVLSDPHGLAAEWFRVLRLRIEDWLEAVGGPPRTLLITSAEGDAGKTFVASNLALLFANQPGIRTLLVDGDLRKPRFEALFGVPRRPGLADVLARRARVEDCVRLVAETGLSVLPAGRPGNPRDLMSPERLEPAFAAMKELADLVIVDSPPMEPMVDARSMATVADGVALVVRADRTRAPRLERSLQTLSSARFVGTVITGVESSQAERAYDGYRRSRG